jgi:hypothetical protein
VERSRPCWSCSCTVEAGASPALARAGAGRAWRTLVDGADQRHAAGSGPALLGDEQDQSEGGFVNDGARDLERHHESRRARLGGQAGEVLIDRRQ